MTSSTAWNCGTSYCISKTEQEQNHVCVLERQGQSVHVAESFEFEMQEERLSRWEQTALWSRLQQYINLPFQRFSPHNTASFTVQNASINNWWTENLLAEPKDPVNVAMRIRADDLCDQNENAKGKLDDEPL